MANNISGTPFPPPEQRTPAVDHSSGSHPASFLRPLPPETPGGRVQRGDFNIRIDRDGVWYYDGSPINRQSLVCLFASVLRRDVDGAYWLVTPAEMGRIEVEDVPFIAVELYVAGTGTDQILSVRTNVDEIVTIDKDHAITMMTDPGNNERLPYVRLREGIDARLSRSVFYELVGLGVEETVDGAHILGVWSSGLLFPLGSTEAEA